MSNNYAVGSVVTRGRPVVFKAAAVESAGSTGGTTTHAVHGNATDSGGSLVVKVVVTGTPGGTTPTLVVVVQGSVDGTTWVTLGKVGSGAYSVGTSDTDPAGINAAATSTGVFPRLNYVRTQGVIGGTATPSFNYAVTGVVC